MGHARRGQANTVLKIALHETLLQNAKAEENAPMLGTNANSAEGQKIALYLEHPVECPELIGTLDYLIHPPGKLSATASWLRFSEEILMPLIT